MPIDGVVFTSLLVFFGLILILTKLKIINYETTKNDNFYSGAVRKNK